MRVLVCGGRHYDGPVDLALTELHESRGPISMIIHGGASGADHLAGEWAKKNAVHYAVVPALWKKLGQKAGPIRNQVMLTLMPDICLAFPGGRGTKDMVSRCKKAGVKVEHPVLGVLE